MVEITELLPGKIYSLKNVLSQEECQRYIDLAEEKGFKQATINVGQRSVAKEDIRNNDTVIRDDAELAKMLWGRVQSHLPEEVLHDEDGTRALGLTDHFRTYR